MHTERAINEEALQQAGKVPDQSARTLMDVKEESVDHLGTSLSCMKDSSSGTVPLCTHTQLVKEEPQVFSSDDDRKSAATSHSGRTLPNLNLSVISTGRTSLISRHLSPEVLQVTFSFAKQYFMSYLIEFLNTDSDSCTLDLNADLNLSPQEQPVLAAPKSTLDSFDCTNRSPATVLHEPPPPEMVAVKIERIEPNTSLLHNDVFDSSEIGASGRNYDQVTPSFDSKQKCLQVRFLSFAV